MIYISVHIVSVYTLTFSNVLSVLALNLIVHKSSYCKCSLAWCQVRTFLLFAIWTHPLQMKEYPLQYEGTDKNTKSHYKQESQNRWRSHFSPLCQLQLSNLKICLRDFFPVLLEWITSSHMWRLKFVNVDFHIFPANWDIPDKFPTPMEDVSVSFRAQSLEFQWLFFFSETKEAFWMAWKSLWFLVHLWIFPGNPSENKDLKERIKPENPGLWGRAQLIWNSPFSQYCKSKNHLISRRI